MNLKLLILAFVLISGCTQSDFAGQSANSKNGAAKKRTDKSDGNDGDSGANGGSGDSNDSGSDNDGTDADEEIGMYVSK